jgi:hypothetical protein
MTEIKDLQGCANGDEPMMPIAGGSNLLDSSACLLNLHVYANSRALAQAAFR